MAGDTETKSRKKWILNAFAMASPGHLAPGLDSSIFERLDAKYCQS
jgi:hypothetical protein